MFLSKLDKGSTSILLRAFFQLFVNYPSYLSISVGSAVLGEVLEHLDMETCNISCNISCFLAFKHVLISIGSILLQL